jgi:ribonuclease J
VNHSIVEAMALFIDTPVGKIVFTGDFKIDPNPYYGKPLDPTPFRQAGDEGVLLLMSDSTNVEHGKKATGLTVIAVFASNISRIGQFFELAHKLGKKVALIGRSMEQNVRAASDIGYLKHMAEVLIPVEDLEKYNRHDCVVLSTGSQGEYRSALVRIANGEHRDIQVGEGDLIVLSSKFIPGNEKAIGKMINSLFMLGAEVLYESVSAIHVSGHANADELRTMLAMTRPKFFIPIHGEYRHLVKHKRLALETNVKEGHAVIAVNGDVWELEADRLEKVDHFEENRVFIESEGGKDVSKVIIKDRRKVAETGVVFSVLIRDSQTGEVVVEPDITSRGLVEAEAAADLMEEAKRVARAIVEDAADLSKSKHLDLQEEIRVGLRRFFASRIGKKPVVLPIVIDI